MKLKLALAMATVILVGSLAVNAYLYAQQLSFAPENGLQQQVNELESQVENLQDEKTDLQNQLQNQLNQTQIPKLVTRLGTKDVRSSPYANHPWSGQIRFYISGEVWNVGRASANSSKLHVTLYQGGAVAKDTYVELGTIPAGSYVDVDANIPYEGDALTHWTIVPEFR